MRSKIVSLLKKPMTGIIISVFVGFIVGAIVLGAAGYNPIEAYGSMFGGMFRKPKYVSQIIINAIPIILTGLSVSFAFKTGLFNIGAEGQYIMGTVTAAMLGYYLSLPGIIHPAVILVAAFLVGGLFGALAGWLKARFGVHEVISTIMLNWIALYFNNFILSLPGVKKTGTQASNEVLETARLTFMGAWKKSDAGKDFIRNNPIWGDFMRTDVHWGILISIVVVIVAWYFLNRTTKGFELRAVGFNQYAAEFAGINVKKNTIIAMFIAGGIAALAGAIHILGTNPFRISVLPITEGYGWDGISVSLIANNNPIGCILSGLLFSGLNYGGGSIQSDIGAPSEIIDIMIGSIVFCVALVSIFPMIADKIKRKGDAHAK